MPVDVGTVAVALVPSVISGAVGVFAARYGAEYAVRSQVEAQRLITERAREDESRLAERVRALFATRLHSLRIYCAVLASRKDESATSERAAELVVKSYNSLKTLHEDVDLVLKIDELEQTSISTVLLVGNHIVSTPIVQTYNESIRRRNIRRKILETVYKAAAVSLGVLGMPEAKADDEKFELEAEA